MVNSYFDGKYWWVVIPDELWEKRETCEYQFGYPIYITQHKH